MATASTEIVIKLDPDDRKLLQEVSERLGRFLDEKQLPDHVCDPDIDHDHDPVPDLISERTNTQ